MGMRPFKLRIDWTQAGDYCWQGTVYRGTGVLVELEVMGEPGRVLRSFDEVLEALEWARCWLSDRGFDSCCVTDPHQLSRTYVVLHPRPL